MRVRNVSGDLFRRAWGTAVLLGTLVMVASCEQLDWSPGPDAAETVTPTISVPTEDDGPPTFEKGERLYNRFCSRCHGPEAAGGLLWPSPLWGFGDIGPIVRDGRGGMPPVVGLNDDHIASIQLYIDSFGSTEGLNGQEVFALLCSGCHGDSALGTDRGFPIRRPARDFATWVIRNGRGSPSFANDMPQYEFDRITDEQLGEMLDWLHTFPEPDDGRGLYEMYCANCHGLDGTGGTSRKDLVDKSDSRGDFYEKVREGEGGTQYGDRREYMPGWPESEISRSEVDRIVDWLQSLRRDD